MPKKMMKRIKQTRTTPVTITEPEDVSTGRVTTCAHCGLAHKTPKELQQHLASSECGPTLDAAKVKRPKHFNDSVDVPDATPEQRKARSHAMVMLAHGARTALLVRRAKDGVTYIPYDGAGLDVKHLTAADFDRQYQPMADYPTGRCAVLYLGFAQNLGATPAALDALATLVSVMPEQRKIALGKSVSPLTSSTPRAKKSIRSGSNNKQEVISMAQKAKTNGKPAAEANGKPAKNGKAPKAAPKARGEAASVVYRELILANKFTDEQIYKKVAAKMGWKDDARRWQVAWWRNHMRKSGQKVPDARA